MNDLFYMMYLAPSVMSGEFRNKIGTRACGCGERVVVQILHKLIRLSCLPEKPLSHLSRYTRLKNSLVFHLLNRN